MDPDFIKRLIPMMLAGLVAVFAIRWYMAKQQDNAPATPADSAQSQTDQTDQDTAANAEQETNNAQASDDALAPRVASSDDTSATGITAAEAAIGNSQSQSASATAATTTDQPPTTATQPAGPWHLIRPQQKAPDVVLGDRIKTEAGYKAQITIHGPTASIKGVLLSEHKLNVQDEETGYPLLAEAYSLKGGRNLSLVCGAIRIEGRPKSEKINLAQTRWSGGELVTDIYGVQTVTFTATIADEHNQPVLDVIKTYRYELDNYELDCNLTFVNHSSVLLHVESLDLIGPTGFRREDPRSGRRRVSAAYRVADDQINVETVQLVKMTGKKPKTSQRLDRGEGSLQWYAVSNKFFTAIVRPIPQADKNNVDYLAPIVARNLYEQRAGELQDPQERTHTIGVSTKLKMEQPLGLAEQRSFGFKVYLGAIDKNIFDERYAGHTYEKLVPVSWCAFEWLTFALVGIMKAVYTVLGNYGVAIIVLVLLVRLLMHPIMKKSQVNMMKMGKMGPQMEEIKKKYANNKQELQKQTMALYKQQGAAPLLGCLPMLLQMPIWVALYTAVDTNVALRHQGLFPASWHWITDLSAPDRLTPFTALGIDPVQLPLIGLVDAFNLLPILLCVAMVLQQKLSPQAQMASSNPQQAGQQKMMMIMMPIMMLVFLYTAPSGLNLYIMASTFGGLIESHFIRKHVKEQEEAAAVGVVTTTRKIGGRMEPKKKKDRPPTKFF